MTYSQPARTTTRRIPGLLVLGLLVVSAAIGAALGYQLQASSSSAAASPIDALRSEHRGAAPATGPDPPQPPGPRDRGPAPTSGPGRFRQPPGRPPGAAAPGRPDAAASGAPGADAPGRPGAAAPGGADPRDRPQRGAPGEADGVVPDGTTVFDEIPGVAKLNPALLGALRGAATDATNDGVKLYVTSGWRSPKYQERLLREAISQYGSEKEAARWVGTPTASAHVSGDAVDIGPFNATAWLSKHGATYGLCRIYGNEPWHYELRPKAIDHGCPPMYADPTQDPRMQR
jgi:zinc D-Ala-D-Ala carboxypeptidase